MNSVPESNKINCSVIVTTDSFSQDESVTAKKLEVTNNGQDNETKHPTTYLETLMHLLKGNIGSGIFAMGDAFRNGGLILSPIMILSLSIICVHSQHILIKCARRLKEKFGIDEELYYAQTVKLCFENGPPKLRKYANFMKFIVNLFLCAVQLGCCCIYIIFISNNFKQIFDNYGIYFNHEFHVMFILLPVLLPCLITNLKYLVPCTTVANLCMAFGIGATLFYAIRDAPNPNERKFIGNISGIPLFFGTAIFAFEGISLVLPLRNAMKTPSDFQRPLGVLNIGMTCVTCISILLGFFGYLTFGEHVAGSLTLNLPEDEIMAQIVKAMVSIGMLLTYPLQAFVAVQIMWPYILDRFGPFKLPIVQETLFRSFVVILTFCVALIVPQLSLFISLLGALCASSLALVFPPVLELIMTDDKCSNTKSGPRIYTFIKNLCIILLACLGFITGTYESISALSEAFFH